MVTALRHQCRDIINADNDVEDPGNTLESGDDDECAGIRHNLMINVLIR